MGGVVRSIDSISISKNNIKNIFISHITEEKEVAIIIKSLIEEIFPKQTEIFVSSDGVSITAGTKWLDEIGNALNKTNLLITLCSDISIKRPWINFELGAGWTKGVPIIPICYLGITKNQLPQPIAMLQAMDLVDDNSLKYMFEGIAKHLGLSLGKRIDYKSMIEEVNESFEKVKYAKSNNKTKNIDENKQDNTFLSEIEIEILKYFMNDDDENSINMLYVIFDKISKGEIKYYVDELCNKKLLHCTYYLNSPEDYSITHEGRAYLIKNDYL
ncbi:toll/interleukin-1 receptor domain-containing protein [Aliarcobacter butzleri]|nr:toll/interleukin-1 receptor domain-containing protein [Aliarcobacter butzleri]MDK2092062.1 toll/interleukin-1 receptor domain-containing protein [Aliarcobacter butzleri]